MTRVSKGTRVNRKHKPELTPTAKYQPGFLTTLDGRSELARTLKLRFDEIANDIGDLSAIKRSLLERFIFLEGILSRIESDLAKANDAKTANEVLGRFVQSLNAYVGLSKVLGIEKQAAQNQWAQFDATAVISNVKKRNGFKTNGNHEDEEGTDEPVTATAREEAV